MHHPMPSEIRHILFQPPEVVAALGAYFRRVGRAVPPGVIIQCGPEQMNKDAPARFRMTIEDERPLANPVRPSGDAAQCITVDGADLAAALILYCRSHKIPLPANASKSLEILGGQLCLAFTKTENKNTPNDEKLRL
jgi:hypothetical protein